MDGRRAAANVLIGAAIGASVPMVATIALVLAVDYFRPLDHLATLLLLSAGCAIIGVVVNLPWDLDHSSKPIASPFQDQEFAEQAKRFEFDAGFDTDASADTNANANNEHHAGDASGSGPSSGFESGSRQRKESATGRGPRGGFSISYRQALNILGLEDGASLDAVRVAYRQLAKQLHPDQFASQGDEAVKQATEQFRDLQEAYALVRSEA